MRFLTVLPRHVVQYGKDYQVDEDGLRSAGGWAPSPATSLREFDGSGKSCALLGEPGIGKSAALRFLTRAENPLIIPLDEVTDVRALREYLQPLGSGKPGYSTLVLDGLDECPLPLKALTRALTDFLRPQFSIRVLIGCRTSEWYPPLGETLRKHFGGFEVLELLPLSVQDIEQLAAERGVDAEAFLSLIRELSLGPLASIPLTLDFLLRLFTSDSGFPREVSALYERGLLALADEPDNGRAKDRTPAGSRGERLAVAARIAATMLLCARSSISLRGADGHPTIDAAELVGGEEPLPAGVVAVTSDLVTGTLATGIFTGAGEGRLSVSHSSFAAFLAARYLTTHRVPEHQLRALLTRTNSLGRTSIPSSLREVAAWIVSMAPEHSWLLHTDPAGVIAHAGVVTHAGLRKEIVAYLLDQPDVSTRLSRRRWRLGYPGLHEQLRDPVRAALEGDCGIHLGHPIARRAHTAVLIARASMLREAVPDIAALVAEPGLNPVLRSSAAFALTELDANRAADVLQKVLREVEQYPERDPDDELRGQALSVCWPSALTASELVAALSAPKRDNFVGAYSMFLRRFVASTPEDRLGEVLDVLSVECGTSAEKVGRVTGSGADRGLAPGSTLLIEILERLLVSDNLDRYESQVTWAVAQCAKGHGRVHILAEHLGGGESSGRQALRRRLVQGALDHLSPEEAPQLLWMWRAPRAENPVADGVRLLDGEDLAWLFELGSAERYTKHAAALLGAVFDPNDPGQQQIAWDHREHELFDESVGWWFQPVALESEQARRSRQYHAMATKRPTWSGAEEHPKVLTDAWDRVRAGDTQAFVGLTLRLWTEPETGHCDFRAGALGDWPSAHIIDFDRSDYLEAAIAFLRSSDPGQGGWMDKPDSLSYPALVGYRIFLELHRNFGAETALSDLTDDDWGRWAPVIIRYANFTFVDVADEDHAALQAETKHRVPAAYGSAYLNFVQTSAARGRPLPDLVPLRSLMDSELADNLNALLPSLTDAAKVAPEDDGPLDAVTLAVASEKLRATASHNLRSLITFLMSHARGDTTHRDLAAVTAHDDPIVWAIGAVASCGVAPATEIEGILNLAFANENLGAAFAAEASSLRDDARWGSLTESQVGRLVRWLAKRWGDDPVDWIMSKPEDQVRDLRDGLIRELAERATDTALQELQRLAIDFPNARQVAERMFEAEARYRDSSWIGPTPAEFYNLLKESKATVVLDEDALYRAVLAALERLRPRLRELGQLLWNESADDRETVPDRMRVWSPKYEPDVSAMLQDHLKQDLQRGVVVNREVLVRQTSSKGHGLAVDVLVGGASEGGTVVTVPVEVKGCWNGGLLTDMDAQLVHDYLPALGAHRGIYVCAWFPPDQWSDGRDSRRARALRLNRDEVSVALRRQASEASTDQIHISAVLLDVPRPVPSDRSSRR